MHFPSGLLNLWFFSSLYECSKYPIFILFFPSSSSLHFSSLSSQDFSPLLLEKAPGPARNWYFSFSFVIPKQSSDNLHFVFASESVGIFSQRFPMQPLKSPVIWIGNITYRNESIFVKVPFFVLFDFNCFQKIVEVVWKLLNWWFQITYFCEKIFFFRTKQVSQWR